MKRILLGVAVCSAAAIASTPDRVTNAGVTTPVQQITRAGTQPSEVAPSEHFTGRARVDRLTPANPDVNASSAFVNFEPGAHTAWHTHPKGQYLVVTAGIGLTQEWGKPIQEIRPGDVVWCPPGIKHWHGATPTTAMTHLAITGNEDGKSVNWMEKVSDEQYNNR